MTLPIKLGLAIIGGGSLVAGSYGVYELIRPKTIADQLKWNGKELLDTKKDNNKDDTVWEKLYAKYGASENQVNVDKFPGDSNTVNDKEKLKEKCREVLVLSLTKESQDNLKQAGFWCVKNSEKLKEG